MRTHTRPTIDRLLDKPEDSMFVGNIKHETPQPQSGERISALSGLTRGRVFQLENTKCFKNKDLWIWNFAKISAAAGLKPDAVSLSVLNCDLKLLRSIQS